MTEADSAPQATRPWLSLSVDHLAGIGPRRQEQLALLGIHTLDDLLHHFPRRHDDLYWNREAADAAGAGARSFCGEVTSLSYRAGRRGAWRASLRTDQGDVLQLYFFQQHWRKPECARGWRGWVTGSVRLADGELRMIHPRITAAVDDTAPEDHARVVAVYPLTAGLRQGHLRRWIRQLLEHEELPASLPQGLLLASTHDDSADPEAWLRSYQQIHLPETLAAGASARRMFARAELLCFALHQESGARQRAASRGVSCAASRRVQERIWARIPYAPTAGQVSVVAEVLEDLAASAPTSRLVHGEVGSGKTTVAWAAILAAIAAGQQAALLAPTVHLAHQHGERLRDLLAGTRVKVAVLTGNCRAAGGAPAEDDTTTAGDDLAEAAVVVGTHALLGASVELPRLALVVVDEEQRFGVQQRSRLLARTPVPHYLALSATPIPRSLAATVYGDMRLSILDDTPPGRMPTQTRVVAPDERDRAWQFLATRCAAGGRVLLVVPRIDGEELESIEGLARQIARGPLAPFGVGVLHGRLPVAEQHAVLAQFRSGESAVLVSTSVVEVGLDIPELEAIWIEGAGSFGLAQLHQLRGRVGRGGSPSWCFLCHEEPGELAQLRIERFAGCNNGFSLAEEDLDLRGEGDVLGVRQSGSGWFRLCHPRSDLDEYQALRRQGAELLDQNPQIMSSPEIVDILRRFGPR